MNKHEVLRRYALALSLVSDPDVAGDLFMDARDEADLIRRANWWRFQQGLPQLSPEDSLPELDAAQAEHALHLARRSVARRKAKGLATAGALVAALLALMGLAAASTPAMDLQRWLTLGHFLLGPTVLGSSVIMIVRGADPGARLLAVWGAMLSISSFWGIWLQRFFNSRNGLPPDHLAWKVNIFLNMLYWLVQIGTAGYVVWRLWPRQQVTGGRV